MAALGDHRSGPHPRTLPEGEGDLRGHRHPISRWYLLPLADCAATLLAATHVRPWHVTVLGGALAFSASVCLPLGYFVAAAALILAAWFCDRLDGILARRQGSVSAWGAWLDANLDELADVVLHAAIALALARTNLSPWPWLFFAAFVCGKYLFLHGLASEAAIPGQTATTPSKSALPQTWLRRLYHLPGDADVRTHLLIALVVTGWLAAALAFVAVYYNARWLVRYLLVIRRLRQTQAAELQTTR
jgi:phosphatidylglycerophosphate synthase